VASIASCTSLIAVVSGQGTGPSKQPADPYAEPFFQQAVMPVLARRCVGCHGADRQSGDLRLDVLALGNDEGRELASRFAARGEANELLHRIRSTDPDVVMPQDGTTLDETERAVLEHWVEQGAPTARWWSLAPPRFYVTPAPIAFADRPAASEPIDDFVRAALRESNLVPAKRASDERWLRRVSLDLIGVPPTPEEIDRFLADRSPDARERTVDRLLASTAFGERWATWWLDLARYADTHGYESDEPRSVWPYRDRVVDSFNQNVPFDQFTREQLAGDLLPERSQEQLIASGFHRNTLVNLEGGAKEDEYKDAALKDRVDTTATVWLAATIACAQCHDHKLEPFTQADYYQLYAYFQPTTDKAATGRSDELEIFFGDPERRRRLEAEAERRREALAPRGADFARRFEAWVERLRTAPDDERVATLGDSLAQSLAKETAGTISAGLRVRLERKFAEVDEKNLALKADLDAAVAEAETYRAATTAHPMVMREGPPALTQVQRRGSFLDLGDYVMPAPPAAFDLPANEAMEANRLQLAEWLVEPEHPRTSRVVVNRVWQRLLGRGIVTSPEDFGLQGAYPSHGPLLDRLSVDFAQSGWDLKALIRRIALSETYAQGSSRAAVAPEAERFFAVGPRYRLDAERVRDTLLAASGLLSHKLGGPPVYPPQPASLFEGHFFEGGFTVWPESRGEDRFRRGLYTFVKRTRLHPGLQTFGATDRRLCTVTRSSAPSPAIALYLLNSQEALEFAYGLAVRTLREAEGADDATRLACAYRICTGERPSPSAVSQLQETLNAIRQEYAADAAAAGETLAAAQPAADVAGRPDGVPNEELAAWVLVANVLLNLDATISQR
jgi:mono/diheme cytochrome c family protein